MKPRSNKLVLIISLFLITGFAATSLASYYVSRASLRSHIKLNELPLTCDNIYSEIQKDLLPPIFISSLMANDTFLREWVIQGENDIDQMVKDAEVHAEEDEKRKATVETRNKGENLAFQIEKQIEEMGDKLDSADKAKLEEAISETRKVLEGDDDLAITTQVAELEKVWQEVGAKFHQQHAGEQPEQDASDVSEQQEATDDTVDADFEVVDE